MSWMNLFIYDNATAFFGNTIFKTCKICFSLFVLKKIKTSFSKTILQTRFLFYILKNKKFFLKRMTKQALNVFCFKNNFKTNFSKTIHQTRLLKKRNNPLNFYICNFVPLFFLRNIFQQKKTQKKKERKACGASQQDSSTKPMWPWHRWSWSRTGDESAICSLLASLATHDTLLVWRNASMINH